MIYSPRNAAMLLIAIATLGLNASASAQHYNVVNYSQRDGRWAWEKLGFSTRYTIGSDGCLVSSLAMLYTSWGYGYNPSTLNAELKRRNAFSGALIKWAQLPGYQGMLNYSNSSADLGRIRTLLDQGYRLTVETRMGSKRNIQHWVAVYGIGANGDLLIVDPWYGDRLWFSSRFGNPKRWVYRVALLR